MCIRDSSFIYYWVNYGIAYPHHRPTKLYGNIWWGKCDKSYPQHRPTKLYWYFRLYR